MQRRLVLVISLLISSLFTLAQSAVKLTGKVTNEKNEPVVRVSVRIAGTDNGTYTDQEGRFALNLVPGKKYEVTFSSVGYETKTITDVEVNSGQINELSVLLTVQTKTSDNVTVTGSRSSSRRETVNAAIAFQKNTNTVASIISAETIRRSPDRNTSDVLKRLPGASVQEGKFVIVRGLADRYNQAMLNGILLTSTEPDRKTFSFDLIPASMIDNLVVNKAFVPEYPGEWAGGMIQVNTKDFPARNFLNIQAGTGFNGQTTGKTFYKDNAGKLDWLGIEDGSRALPASYTTKSDFDILTPAEKTAIGKQMPNRWVAEQLSAPLNVSFQVNGGFTAKIGTKRQLGGLIGINYAKNNRFIKLLNQSNSLSGTIFSANYSYDDDRYQQDVTLGGLASLSYQFNASNKVTARAIVNITSPQSVTQRSGIDYNRDEQISGSEFTFKQNTFFTTQLTGEHTIIRPLKLKWYGAFNILDGYIPDQRRILYSKQNGSADPYRAILSNTLSQQSGSRIYQNLSDYIYTGGGDFTYTITSNQTIKAGYMFQVKDRLYDAKLFANYLPADNDALRRLTADKIFAPENFGNGTGTLFGFDAIKGNTFRYLANTILNAGYLQFDNQLTRLLRVVWGLRVENYDQLVGSVKAWDPRHTHSEVTDFLPGLNATLKLNSKTNIRLSGSQTVIRPELRELSFLNLYDFELNASVQGNPALKRTKVTNFDLRYELYPRPGEVFTAGVFYKHFSNPIEQLFNEGSGGASTFSFQNPEKAKSYGAEIELRKKLDFVPVLKNITLQANGAYIYSRIKDKGFNVDRPLQGQSPYVMNLGLLYDAEKLGLTATILYNRIGERIYLVGDISAGAGSPDIYEAPRSLLDFQLSKKMLKKKADLRLSVSDILATTQYFYQNAGGKASLQKNEDAYRFTRKFGTTYSISFNYSL